MSLRKIFKRNKRGASLTPYALVVGLIAVIAITAITKVGTSITTLFETTAEKMETVAGNTSGSGGSGGGSITATDDSANAPTGTAWVIDVLANDTGSSLTITNITEDSLAGGSAGGVSAITDGGTTITITADVNGAYSFTYTISDGATTDTATLDITATAAQIVDNTGDADDGNYTTGNYTLREALFQSSNGDSILFDPSIANSTITFASLINFADFGVHSLTIDGTGRNITLSGGTATRLFHVPGATTYTIGLKDLTFRDAYCESSSCRGAVINITHNLIVTDCNFIDNITGFPGASSAIAGAISFGGSIFTITNSLFDGNKTEATGTTSPSAGAIYVSSSAADVTITNSIFRNNVARNAADRFASGGAINFSSQNSITISNTTFENNIVDGGDGANGGALYIQSTTTTIDITNSSFDNNQSNSLNLINDATGGAIYVNMNTGTGFTSTGNSFDNNAVTGASSSLGGAFYLTGFATQTFTFSNTTIQNNTLSHSSGTGAAIEVDAANVTLALQSGTSICGNSINAIATDSNQINLPIGSITPVGADSGYSSGGILVAGTCP